MAEISDVLFKYDKRLGARKKVRRKGRYHARRHDERVCANSTRGVVTVR